jgi:xylulose-5-phosphate/fructose-6-phosphate phosphoketolase
VGLIRAIRNWTGGIEMTSPQQSVLVQEPPSTSLSAYGKARSTVQGSPLSPEEVRKTHAYWRACNYLALGMIYLQANPLLKEPLNPEHI